MSVKDQVRDIVIRVARLDKEIVNEPGFLSRPLPIDSMLAIEIMANLEKNFQIEIPEEDLFKFDRLENIMEIVDRLVAAGAGQLAEEPARS